MICYFNFEAIPKHSNPESSEIGGAYINCWVDAEDMTEGELYARQYIDENGWIIGSKENDGIIDVDDYRDDAEASAFLLDVEECGAVFDFYKWPLGSDDDDNSYEEGSDLPA